VKPGTATVCNGVVGGAAGKKKRKMDDYRRQFEMHTGPCRDCDERHNKIFMNIRTAFVAHSK